MDALEVMTVKPLRSYIKTRKVKTPKNIKIPKTESITRLEYIYLIE